MGENDVKILGGWPSPFMMRPRIAFNIKSVEYELLEEKFGPKSDLLLKSNLVYKKVPVLIHGDKPICESLIIVQYIDEVWTSVPSILPSDPYDRAIAQFWAAYIEDKVRYEDIISDSTYLDRILMEGAIKAVDIVDATLNNVYQAMGFFQ